MKLLAIRKANICQIRAHGRIKVAEVENLRWLRVICTLRDGSNGHVLLAVVPQSAKVHSIRDDGTWKRLDASNRQMTAAEITELSYHRGVISAETESVPIPFELLKTDTWRRFRIWRAPIQTPVSS